MDKCFSEEQFNRLMSLPPVYFGVSEVFFGRLRKIPLAM